MGSLKMQWNSTKNRLFVLTALIITIYIFFRSPTDTSPILIDSKTETKIEDIETSNTEKKNPLKTIANSNSNKQSCATIQFSKVKQFARPLWTQFKTDIHAEGIRFPVLQLAIYDEKPIQGFSILNANPRVPNHEVVINTISNIPQESQQKLFGLMLSKGASGIITAVKNGDLPKELLTNAGHFILEALINISAKTQTTNMLPNEDELIRLVEYGLEITAKDYNLATKVNAPIEFLQLITSLGPAPEAENNLHEEIPLDIAAKNANLELMEFWLTTDFVHSNKLFGGNFSDTLLLNSTSTAQLEKYWSFLTRWNQFPQDPATAKKLLASSIFKISGEMKQFLILLSKEVKPRIQLAPADKQFYLRAKNEILSINQVILKKFPEYLSCENSQQQRHTDRISKKWLADQIRNGKTLQDILKILSLQSPQKVDRFRTRINRGVYVPLIMPGQNGYMNQISEEMQQAFGFLLLKDWEGITNAIDNQQFNDATLFMMLSDAQNFEIPDTIKSMLENQIKTLPKDSISLIPSVLSIEQLENIEFDTDTLNQVDNMGKNIFYYATKKNNPDLMRWLVQNNINMDPDVYGTDPMDLVLKWNTHPQSLSTLCELGFPIKPRHRKRFSEIESDDPSEAKEILESCPGFEG